jgi:Tol biopolymer transport system component
MPLTPGSRLGPYEVLSPLGAGGMGEVFRARDSRLGRDVAVKVLPEAFAADPERLARFEREARLLASLSHPNIAGIHGLEEVGGHRHLILELVEGETLAERLARGPLPVDETLDVARQVAAALDAAHEAGIVHRDLKPGNVMLTATGDAKVLDFGLARGGGSGPSGTDIGLSASPTMTYAATMAGVILGTAAYMSPEQARGRAVDRRTDIWSFGCVLYECLVGKALFGGETVSDTIAKILERDPDWSALPPKTPPRVRELLRRCLEKDAKKRQRDAGDIKIELDEILAAGVTASGTMIGSTVGGVGGAVAAAVAPARGFRSARVAWGVAAVAVLAAMALALWPRPVPKAASGLPLRSQLLAPADAQFGDAVPAEAAISPDGRLIVVTATDSTGTSHLYVRPLDGLDARKLPRTDVGEDGLPFWSPDSRRIGFFAEGKLKSIAVDGSSVQVLCDAPDARGGAWNADGVILFAPTSTGPLHRVMATGGKSEPVLPLDEAAGETAQRFPRFLPDGQQFTYTSLPARDGELATFLCRLGSTERKLLTSGTAGAVFLPPDRVIVTRGQNLLAQRVDISGPRLIGDPVVIGESPGNLRTNGTNCVTAAPAGTIVFPTRVGRTTYLEWLSRSGRSLGRIRGLPEGNWFAPRLSPDDHLVAIGQTNDARETNIWMLDPARGTASPFTREGDMAGGVIWTPDSREVLYAATRGASGRQDLYARRTSGTMEERLVYADDNMFKSWTAASPDGRWFVYQDLHPERKRDLLYIPAEGGEPKAFVTGPGEEAGGSFSPDGRWYVYTSDESGRMELYVVSFPDGDRRVQITSEGGTAPRWPTGGEILYRRGNEIWSVPIRIGERVEPGTPLLLCELDDVFSADFTSDGQRILAIRPTSSEVRGTYTVLTNWESLLEIP